MTKQTLTMLAVGDVWINRPDPKSAFELVAPVLRDADIVFGNGEAVYTKRGINQFSKVENQPCDPDNIEGLRYAGFHAMNLAQNHIFDWGPPGVEDTANGMKERGIAVFGAGRNIEEARKPAILERKATRVGFLGYWCGNPKEAWAAPGKPGAAYVKIHTHYEPSADASGVPAEVFTFANPTSLNQMVHDITKLRPQCDTLIVSLHTGVVHVPVKVAMHDQQVARAAVDAGADLVVCHHSHILKGVEFYRGKAIFYGLCNFVFDWELSCEPSHAAQEWAQKRKAIFGFEPDPEYPMYPFHPDAKKTIIAKLVVENGQIIRVGYLPCLINKQGQPEILKQDERGRQVFDYMEKITRGAGLNARYRWNGDEVIVFAD